MRSFNFHLHLDGKRELTVIDKSMTVAAVVSPLMTLPQIWLIFSTESAVGVSLFTWASYLIFNLVFLTYGIAHTIKPLIVTSVIWIIMDILVVTGTVVYR